MTSVVAASRRILLAAAVLWVLASVAGQWHTLLGFDCHAYWAAWRNELYSAAPQQRDAYLYSPAFAQLIYPMTRLPWAAFLTLWTLANAAIFGWLLWPMGRRGVAAFAFCIPAILIGNVWALLALVMVLGFRRPACWAFPLLTKITPAVGVLWFAARREWRPAGVALAVAAAVTLVSAAADPPLWTAWLHLLTHPQAAASPGRESVRGGLAFIPFAPRLLTAAALTVWAARSDRRWAIPIAGALATPVFGIVSLSVCAAVPRLRSAGDPA
jgi:hypothetical protein